jgi:ABC-type sugar transport system substrate-binding protein
MRSQPAARAADGRPVRIGAAALAVTTLLAGCGTEPPATPEPAVLVVSGRQVDFVSELSAGFVEGVQRVSGVAYRTAGPDVVDNASQLRILQDLLGGRRGSITVFTFAPELFANALGGAASAGTPVVALHSVPAPGSRVPLYVGNDNHALGTQLGAALADRIPAGAGGVVIVGSPHPGVTVLDDRVAGVREAVQQRRPGVTVIGPFDTKQAPAANKRAWQVLQAANPEALAFVGVGGADARNLALLQEPGTARVDGGFGTDRHALELTATGSMVLVSTEPYLQGMLAGAIQARCAKDGGQLPTGWLPVPGLLVDAANAPAIIARQQTGETKEAWFREHADTILADLPAWLRPMAEAR